jgi:GNAT superfamily N-acetyltransferase
MDFTITIEEAPSAEDVAAVRDGLNAYNDLYTPSDKYRRLALILRSPDGKVAGGLLGETYWEWLHVGILWIQSSARGQGIGSELLARAEEEARGRGCHSAFLDTLSFQALPFYQHSGYEIFGELANHPFGHTRYFLKKKLQG